MVTFIDGLHYYDLLNKELGLSLNWEHLEPLTLGTARYLRPPGICQGIAHTHC